MVQTFDIYDTLEANEPFLKSVRVSKQPDMDEGFSLVLQLLLWCSGWGVVDTLVQSIVADNLRHGLVIYSLIAMVGCVSYCAIHHGVTSSSSWPNLAVPRSVFEFGSLILSCTGSWGLINSLVSMLAIGSKIEEVLIHILVFAISAFLTFLHHKYRRPHSVLGQLVD